MTFRVIVCGGRDYADYPALCATLDRLLANRLPDVVIVHGAAPGADSLAKKYADERGLADDPYKAEWRRQAARAGLPLLD